jgi:hypothetical protein
VSDVTGQDLLNQSYAQVLALQSTIESSLSNLTAIANGQNLTWFDFSATPTPPTIPPTPVALGAIPTLTTPAMTTAPDFGYTPVGFDALQSAVMDIIDSGGANVSPTIQDAVYNQGIERDLQTQRMALDLAGARTGSKGFRIPNGMTTGLQNQVIQEFAWRKSDQSRTLTQTIGELVTRNLQMAIASGTSIQEALANIAIKTYEVLLDGQRLVLERFKTQADVALVSFKEEVATIIAVMEADIETQKLSMERQGLIVKEWEVTVNALVEKGKSQIAQAETSNALMLTAIDSLAKSYIGIAQTMGNQGVAITTHNT